MSRARLVSFPDSSGWLHVLQLIQSFMSLELSQQVTFKAIVQSIPNAFPEKFTDWFHDKSMSTMSVMVSP